MTTIDRIKALIIDYLVETALIPREEVASGEVKLMALNIDSLSMVEMLWEVESKYGVTIARTDMLRDMTLNQMAAYLAEQHAPSGLESLPQAS